MQLADNWRTHVVPYNHAIHMDGFCFLECVNMSMQCICVIIIIMVLVFLLIGLWCQNELS